MTLLPLVPLVDDTPDSAGETAAKSLVALLASKAGRTVYVSKPMAADAAKAAAWLASDAPS